MRPLVSIIIPLYNYARYVKSCLTSILNQDYDNFEIVVVDDCSTDKSRRVVRGFLSDKLHLLCHGSNKGYSVAKNSGIIASKGDYIIVLDADDMLTRDSISSRIKVMLNEDSEFIHADAIFVSGDISLESCYRMTDPNILHCPSPYSIHAQTVMVKKDVYKRFGLYEERLKSVSDMEMWWRFFGQTEKDEMKIKRSYISYPVVYYRDHGKSMTVYRRKHPQYNEEVKRIAQEVYQRRTKEGINNDNTIMLVD